MDSLDVDQQQAVDSQARTLRVLAGAGSGKTRVLTQRVARRIADESADPAHTLVLTFTRKAADELRDRLRNVSERDAPPVVTGTFHAVAYAQLRRRWADQNRTPPALMSSSSRSIATVLETLRMSRLANPRLLHAEISWAKSRQLTPKSYMDGLSRFAHRPPVGPAQMERIYEAYELEKKKRRTIDYDDLFLLMTDALRTDRSFAATQRWQFKHFFVDEFQDLNTAQFELLRSWLGGRDDLFVVGDSNQAIYGWNGADSSYLNSLEKHFPNIETITLHTNYRSSKSVLAAAQSLINDEGNTPDHAEVGARPVLREFDDDMAEAVGIARAARAAHHKNIGWSDIAVLVRTNAQRTVIETELEKLQIPFTSAGGASWLYANEVRGALEYLRGALKTMLVQRLPDIDELIEEAVDDESGYLRQVRLAMQSCLVANPSMTVGDFLSWVEVGSKQDGPASNDGGKGAVTVTTFHRAKGLEWPVVFLAGLEDGLVPISSTDSEEERRLFYVAVTRAQDELHLSWAHKRLIGATIKSREPSPWLRNIATSSGSLHDASQQDVHVAIDEGREVLHVEVHDVVPARVALERWRASHAKLTGVEARLILDDAVIEDIINLRPTSRAELADIEGIGPVRAANIGDQLLELIK